MLLQGAEFGHGIAPALGTGAAVAGLSDVDGKDAGLAAFPVTALLLGGCEGHEGVSFAQSLITPVTVPALQATSSAVPAAGCSPAR